MIAWGLLRSYIQNGMLKDIDESKYSPVQMMVWARWACAEISMHTAQCATYDIPGDSLNYRFVMPEGLIGNIEHEGLVTYVDNANANNLGPYRMMPDVVRALIAPNGVIDPALSVSVKSQQSPKGYYVWPQNILNLTFIPATGEHIVLNYFKIWDAPQNDESVLEFPQWMEQAFSYYVAAAAMGPYSVQASQIRQWGSKPDTGTPEHNPLQKQADFFIKQAMRLLERVSPQDRENFYRVGGTDRQS